MGDSNVLQKQYTTAYEVYPNDSRETFYSSSNRSWCGPEHASQKQLVRCEQHNFKRKRNTHYFVYICAKCTVFSTEARNYGMNHAVRFGQHALIGDWSQKISITTRLVCLNSNRPVYGDIITQTQTQTHTHTQQYQLRYREARERGNTPDFIRRGCVCILFPSFHVRVLCGVCFLNPMQQRGGGGVDEALGLVWPLPCRRMSVRTR